MTTVCYRQISRKWHKHGSCLRWLLGFTLPNFEIGEGKSLLHPSLLIYFRAIGAVYFLDVNLFCLYVVNLFSEEKWLKTKHKKMSDRYFSSASWSFMFIIKTSMVTSGEPWKWPKQRQLFLLYWPGFRHKQEVAHRKEAIFFTAVVWTKTATSTYILRCLMSATGYSVSNTTPKNDEAGLCFGKLWSLPLPVTN